MINLVEHLEIRRNINRQLRGFPLRFGKMYLSSHQ